MPEYLSPGVYMEEISIGPKPIEGVGTSTAGMLGLTERGPVGVRLVTNMGEYQRYYGGYLKDSFLPNAVEGFFGNGGARCFIGRIAGSSAAMSKKDYSGLYLRATGPGVWGNRVGFLVLNTSGDTSAHPMSTDSKLFKMIIAYWKNARPVLTSVNDLSVLPKNPADFTSDHKTLIKEWESQINAILDTADMVESFDELSIIASSPNYFSKIINAQSFLIRMTKSAGSEDEEKPDSDLTNRPGNLYKFDFLDNGATTDPAIELDDFKGNPAAKAGKRTGIEAFKDVDEINIVYCPDVYYTNIDSEALIKAIVGHCELMKDRFAIIDSPQGQNIVSAVQKPVDSTYAAFYYPWIKVYDPLLKDRKLIPPGGFVAGVYARSDIERGVHKAPANEIVKGALELEFPLSKAHQAILNPKGINAIRQFPGRGIRVWGARTTSSDPEWKYINVRRLFLYVEESIEKGTQWVVFEPNNEQLWARVKQSIVNFLTTVWRDGALMGSTPEQAFFVDIGFSTMTPADLDNGKLICMIGIAPTKPAEFVIFRIYQKTLEVK
ncbi:phage tail sheath family protein [bacterium]|nr:phage tail sheath family protein [candidate division CSSED10-310 bacterium]